MHHTETSSICSLFLLTWYFYSEILLLIWYLQYFVFVYRCCIISSSMWFIEKNTLNFVVMHLCVNYAIKIQLTSMHSKLWKAILLLTKISYEITQFITVNWSLEYANAIFARDSLVTLYWKWHWFVLILCSVNWTVIIVI